MRGAKAKAVVIKAGGAVTARRGEARVGSDEKALFGVGKKANAKCGCCWDAARYTMVVDKAPVP